MNHQGESPADQRPTSRQSSSRGGGQPPATEPALPPIRSGRSQTDSNGSLPPDRSLVSAGRSGRHEVMAEDLTPPQSPQRLAPSLSATASSPPLIIPGDGKPIASPMRLPRRKPSRTMHLTLISVSFCLTLAALWAATPLTVGAASGVHGFFVAASLRALPTATPTATPQPVSQSSTNGGGTSPNPGATAIINEIKSVFGSYAGGAINVASCESGFDPNARNPISVMGSHAEGVFQILYPITWDSTSEAGSSPYNADANILAAHQIFSRDGNSWREWSCQP